MTTIKTPAVQYGAVRAVAVAVAVVSESESERGERVRVSERE